MPLPPGKCGTDDNGGKSQRKRFWTQTFEPRLRTADISHSYLANKNGAIAPINSDENALNAIIE